MASNLTKLRTVTQSIQHYDPRLYEALRGIIEEIEALNTEVFPGEDVTAPAEIDPDDVGNVTDFTFSFNEDGIILVWGRPLLADGTIDYSIQFYEIKLGTTTDTWETANSIFQANALTTTADPLLVGTYVFFIKAFSAFGGESDVATTLQVTVPVMGPIGTVSGSVIDNNVQLAWGIPESTFRIAHYNIYKNDVKIAEVGSNIFSFFEEVAGSYKYGVEAEDLAGNLSPIESITVEVDSPPDYFFQTSFLSVFAGAKVNCEVFTPTDTERLVACITTDETWQQHFDNNSWTTIQDQIDAGFPIYIQPTESTGSYVEVIDFGEVFTDVTINMAFVKATISPDVTILPTIEFSVDGIIYSTPQSALSVYAQTLQFVRVTFQFTATA